MKRRHDIDALRALAFGLVIVYHLAMYYVADWHWHLKSPHAAEWLQAPMRALNLWRMDLVFLISGLALGFLRRGAAPVALLGQRSWRLLLPLAFGMAVVIPYQPYAQALAGGYVSAGFGDFLLRYFGGGPWPKAAFDGADPGVTWNHLWYLAYLWVYTAVFVMLLPLLDSRWGLRARDAFRQLRGAGLLLPALPLAIFSLVLWPHFPPTRDLIHDGWLHAVYFTLFLYGYWIGTDAGWWDEVTRLRWPLLAGALVLLAAYFAARAAVAPSAPLVAKLPVRWLADGYVWCTLLAVLGWSHRLLNRPWPWLTWANESVYPWYMLHQTLIIVGVAWLAPLQTGPWIEPLLLAAFTLGCCWGLTALIRRSHWLRPLFGLKRRAPPRYPSPSPRARPAARSA
jgi:glucan biosynthesis protein C